MPKLLLIICSIVSIVMAYAFLQPAQANKEVNVKQWYRQQAKALEQEVVNLQQLSAKGSTAALQQQFIRTRLAYKKIETLTEYYYSFFAVKLNGPAIPFFEEDEPDRGQQEPAGLQLAETYLFPAWHKKDSAAFNAVLTELLQDIQMLQATDESNAFSNELVADAVMEELYRITALGTTGFDASLSGNALSETAAALNGVQQMVQLYQTDFERTQYDSLQQLLQQAQQYLQQHNNFNAFSRMEFIIQFMNPATALMAKYTAQHGFKENPSPMFYSTVNKTNTLFAAGAFNANKYLDDNTTSPEKIALGKMLFYEKQLSADGTRSCATCHNPQKAFTDGLPTSLALDGHSVLPRNAPTLINTALQRNLFLDNRSPSLEDQVMQVLNNAKEMHGSAQKAAQHIIGQAAYISLYSKAYANADTSLAAKNICNAIACYERTLIALNARFDRQLRGEKIMTTAEINGFNLFMGKAKCGTCHFMPLFSGAKPPRYYYNETEVIGVPAANTNATKLDADPGRYAITQLPVHHYAFKTPTLRNIALTAPYMHNGVFKTLDAVLDFYNKGGGRGLHLQLQQQTLPSMPLHLTATEQKNIIAFLQCLTDTATTR
ncbi:MAG: cytochrome-c peroxidase [Bacteroidetes bacterium]|nr:cytochrome-c peroxidase [Bacteroidota bacterium]